MRLAFVLLLPSLAVLACTGAPFTSDPGLGNTTASTGSGGANTSSTTSAAGGHGGATVTSPIGGGGGAGGSVVTGPTGGSGGGATTGSTGAGGGGAECTQASDCTSVEQSPCIASFDCADGQCVPVGKAAGTDPGNSLQTPHDCNKIVCDGDGGTKTVPDDGDAPIADNVCVEKTCEKGKIVSTPVEGAVTIRCGPNNIGECVNGVCVVQESTCDDGVKGENEADVDCGQVCEKPCGLGKQCGDKKDCASDVCGEPKICLPAHCGDGKLELGKETDKDCGGPCNKCALGKDCKSASDCASGTCGWEGIPVFGGGFHCK